MQNSIVGKVNKLKKDSVLGISLKGEGTEASPITIAGIRGEFAKTNLVPGLRVKSINGLDVQGMSSKNAVKLLKDADVGETTVVASGIVASCTKKNLSDSVGISLKKDVESNAIVIARIAKDSHLAESGLEVGQQVKYINNKKCPTATIDAVRMLKQDMTVTIVAYDPEDAQTDEEQSDDKSDGTPVSIAAEESKSRALEFSDVTKEKTAEKKKNSSIFVIMAILVLAIFATQYFINSGTSGSDIVVVKSTKSYKPKTVLTGSNSINGNGSLKHVLQAVRKTIPVGRKGSTEL